MGAWSRVCLLGASAALGAAAMAAPAARVAPPVENKTIRVLVVADQESLLAAQMVGRVGQVAVQLGSAIRAGQVLLRFHCDEQEAHLNMANAELYGARQTHESKLKLQAMQSVADIEVQQAAAAAQRAKAQTQLYQAQLKQCTISAPFSGRVTKLHVKSHESVNIGQALVEVVNDRKLKVQLNVPSLWLAWMKPGAAFSMQIDETGKSYEARVARINGRVDPVSQSVEIEGEVVGTPANLLPGMSGVASFAQANKP
jgi:membrane fusion protein (multidrug efflux system)